MGFEFPLMGFGDVLEVASPAEAGHVAFRGHTLRRRSDYLHDVREQVPAPRARPGDLSPDRLTGDRVPNEHDLPLMASDAVAPMGDPVDGERDHRRVTGGVTPSAGGCTASVLPSRMASAIGFSD